MNKWTDEHKRFLERRARLWIALNGVPRQLFDMPLTEVVNVDKESNHERETKEVS